MSAEPSYDLHVGTNDLDGIRDFIADWEGRATRPLEILVGEGNWNDWSQDDDTQPAHIIIRGGAEYSIRELMALAVELGEAFPCLLEVRNDGHTIVAVTTSDDPATPRGAVYRPDSTGRVSTERASDGRLR